MSRVSERHHHHCHQRGSRATFISAPRESVAHAWLAAGVDARALHLGQEQNLPPHKQLSARQKFRKFLDGIEPHARIKFFDRALWRINSWLQMPAISGTAI